MHIRRIVCLILGAWIGVSVLWAAMAMQNFRQVDEVLAEASGPAVDAVKRQGGSEQARLFLRHLVGEINRFWFEAWGIGQIVIASGLLLLLLFGSREGKGILLLATLLTIWVTIMHLLITPSIVGLGRVLDWQARDALPLVRQQFGAWHGAYSTMEIGKLILCVAMAVAMVRVKPASRRKGDPLGDNGDLLPAPVRRETGRFA